MQVVMTIPDGSVSMSDMMDDGRTVTCEGKVTAVFFNNTSADEKLLDAEILHTLIAEDVVSEEDYERLKKELL